MAFYGPYSPYTKKLFKIFDTGFPTHPPLLQEKSGNQNLKYCAYTVLLVKESRGGLLECMHSTFPYNWTQRLRVDTIGGS